jgi:centrosomal CEP192-like protein
VRKLVVAIAVLLVATGGASALGAGSVDGQALNFGHVAIGVPQTKTETLTNQSGGPLAIDSVSTDTSVFDVQNDNCSNATLNQQGDQCTVDVRYSPTSGGADSGNLVVSEGGGSDSDTFALSGTGVVHEFSFTNPPGNPDFGNVAVGDTTGQKQITVTNNTDYGDNPNVHLGGSDPGQFNPSDDCGANVTDFCTAKVSFQPTSQGPKSATLLIQGDSFGFSGTGVDPVTVQPTDLSFVDQHVGTTGSAQPITVTNNQSLAITVNVSGNPADYNVDASDCTGHQLAGNGTPCTILVAFSPNSQGQHNESLTVEGQAVQLAGRGTAALLGVAPASLSFGNQPLFTQSATQSVTVTNNGNESMTVNAPALSGPGANQFAISDGCQPISPIPPNGQCSVTVQFTPSSTGTQDAVLTINSPNSTNSPQTVGLHGTGTPSAVVFNPGPAPFKRPHHAGTFSTPKLITLTNRTSGPLTISGVSLGGLNPRSFRITAGNCAGRTLAADDSCTEKVRFAPNEVGVKSASLVVDDDGPSGPHSVQLTGRATYPKDDVAVRGAAGCDATKITWRRGGSSRRFAGTAIVRSRTHIPTGPGDGSRLSHGGGVLHDRGLRHFTAYEYRVFAMYRSHTRPGTLNHSRGIILRLRTGEICAPMDGAAIGDTTPTASWLRHATLFGYSFRLFHGSEEVQRPRFVNGTSFTFKGRRRLHRGFTYTLFLYAYPASQPEGTAIGQTTFRVR